jgi:hypothetical protein
MQLATVTPEVGGQAYNIAMLAPPWIPIPPEGYGGIEQVDWSAWVTRSLSLQHPDRALQQSYAKCCPNATRTR